MFKLLIIDDEPGIRFTIQRIFRSDTVEVLTAADGRQALELVTTESPHVVLLDYDLGSQSGLQLLDEILDLDSKCVIVIITGQGTSETEIEAKKRGAFDYLEKPLDVNRLKQVIQHAFAGAP